MKKLISLLTLSLCCFAVTAQPTSLGGITPGQTTLEELKGLGNIVGSVTGDMRFVHVKLKQLEGTSATVSLQNGVVYEVSIRIDDQHELKPALFTKYGRPQMTFGGLRKIECQNKSGATYDGYEGDERRLWPVRDGVQGEIQFQPGVRCSGLILEMYVLKHVATVLAMQAKREEEARAEAEKRRSKFNGAL
jgi:hypothetical protein